MPGIRILTGGAPIGGLVGLMAAGTTVVLSGAVWVEIFDHPVALVPDANPSLSSMPLAVVAIWAVSTIDRTRRGDLEGAASDPHAVRSETGIGAASAHGRCPPFAGRRMEAPAAMRGRGLFDVPRPRKRHRLPTRRGDGLLSGWQACDEPATIDLRSTSRTTISCEISDNQS